MRRKLNLLGVSGVALTILYLSIRTPESATGVAGPNGYLLHGVAYFVLAAALMTYFHDTRRGHLEAILLASMFGLGIELIQMNLAYRVFGIYDALANTAGASLILLDHKSVLVGRFIRLEDDMINRIFSDVF